MSLFRTAFVDQLAEMVSSSGATAARGGGRDWLGPAAAERLYRCADGWICVVARGAEEGTALSQATGVLGIDDAPPEGVVASALAAWIGERSRSDALAALAAAGVPAVPCLGFAELFTDPHLLANGCFHEGQDPDLGLVVQSGPLVDLEKTPVVHRRSAPRLGEHGVELLREIGYDATRIEALLEGGSVGRPR